MSRFLIPVHLGRFLYAGLFACALFGFPAVSTLPVFLGIDSRPVSVVFRIALLTASVALLVRAVIRREAMMPARYAAVAASLMGVMVGRLLWDSSIAALPLALDWSDFWSFAIGVTFVPSLAFLVRGDDLALDLAYRWSVRLGTVTLVMLFSAAVVALTDWSALQRLTTGVLNPISIGHVGVSLFVLLAFAPPAVRARRSESVGRQVAYNLGLVLSTILVLASASKGPALVWLLAVMGWITAIFFGSVNSGGGLKQFAPALVLVTLLAGATFFVNSVMPLPLVNRITGFAIDPSTSDRVRVLSEAISQFEESPLLGSAVVEYSSRFYPHNIVVESLMAGGVVAFALLSTLLFLSARSAAAILRHRDACRWLAFLFLQFVIDSMLSGSLYFSPQFWAMSLVVLGLQPVGKPNGGSP